MILVKFCKLNLAILYYPTTTKTLIIFMIDLNVL